METYGEAPQRMAFDGSYASRANLADAKELGVEHVVFHKKCGLEIMANSSAFGRALKQVFPI